MKNNKKKIYHILVIIQVILLIVVSVMPVAKAQLGNLTSEHSDTKDKIENNKDKTEENTSAPEASTKEESLTAETEENTEIQEKIATMSLEEKVAQLFIISPEALTGADAVTRAGDATKEALDKYPVGGLFYTSLNIGTREQLSEMLTTVQEYGNDRIGLPLFLGVQEEGGGVSPFGGNDDFDLNVAGAESLGNSGDAKEAQSAGKEIGSYLSDLGFNYTVGPVADIIKSDDTAIMGRAFGSDTDTVSSMVSSQVKGIQSEDVSAVLKYFPGKGNISEGEAGEYEATSQKLSDFEKDEFEVYKKGIEAGADFVMVGHIVAKNVTGDNKPSSLSSIMISDILRGELGFDGIVMTEALSAASIMTDYSSAEAAVEVIKAGGDVIFLPDNFEEAYNGLLDAVDAGEITEERIDESVARVLRVKMGE